MKKFWHVMTAVLMCVMLASAVGAEVEGDFTYVVLNGQATITAASTDIAGDVVIPETLGGYPVTAIGSGAFYDRDGMTSLTIPDGIILSDCAIYSCYNLENIYVYDTNEYYTSIDGVLYNKDMTILIAYPPQKSGVPYIVPNGVQEINKYSFYYCHKLINVILPNSIISIGDYAFSGCDRLNSIDISKGVTHIGKNAFYGCDGLNSIIIPDSVLYIGESCFSNCKSLTNVTLSNSITSIERATFDFCESLTRIDIPEGVTTIGDSAFFECGLSNITIPDSVTSIGVATFYRCGKLSNIVIPKNVTSIGRSAFYGCINLNNITILGNLTSIESETFSSCSNLTSITIPDGVTYIGGSAFSSCSKLTNVIMPNSLKTIASKAFSLCKNLTIITIPVGVTTINSSAFSSCENLTVAIIPKTVSSINKTVFSLCPNLTIYGYANTYAQTYAAEHSIPFIALDEAAVPQFTADLTSAEYSIGSPAILSVTASAADNGSLSYQWYVSDTPDGDGTPIDGATEASYTAPTDTAGVKYYYVIVTNTSETETGVKTATARSTAAAVTVIAKTDAESPVIFAQTHSSACRAGDDTALFVSASVSDGGALTYQWYVSDASGDDGSPIEGAVSAGYKPQTDEDGVKYYYVIITNTNPSATGAQTTSVRSEEMALTVGGGYITGDVDASGLTDSDDAAVLAQYFAGLTLPNPDAADIDSDQALTRRDAMVLTRYLSGWKEYNTLIRYSVYE